VLLLDFSSVINIEYTALKMLTDADLVLRQRGTTLWLASLNPRVRKMVERAPLGNAIRGDRLFPNLQAAVEKYVETRLGRGRQ
jgi:SulP family sulfate permease